MHGCRVSLIYLSMHLSSTLSTLICLFSLGTVVHRRIEVVHSTRSPPLLALYISFPSHHVAIAAADSPPLTLINAGLQYSFSPACVSTQTKLSAIKSSTTACALGRSHPRFNCNILTVTYPRSWTASRTVLWSVFSSLGTLRIRVRCPIFMSEKHAPSGARQSTARRMSSSLTSSDAPRIPLLPRWIRVRRSESDISPPFSPRVARHSSTISTPRLK